MDRLRRSLLRGIGASTLLPWLGAGLLMPTRLLAAEWNRPAFTARSLGDALKAWGGTTATETRDIVIAAPEIAENGARVEVEITCNLPGAVTLAVFADKNPFPLCAALDFSGGALPYARLQLKLAESTRVRALARTADGKTHVASREIRVTIGGCG